MGTGRKVKHHFGMPFHWKWHLGNAVSPSRRPQTPLHYRDDETRVCRWSLCLQKVPSELVEEGMGRREKKSPLSWEGGWWRGGDSLALLVLGRGQGLGWQERSRAQWEESGVLERGQKGAPCHLQPCSSWVTAFNSVLGRTWTLVAVVEEIGLSPQGLLTLCEQVEGGGWESYKPKRELTDEFCHF